MRNFCFQISLVTQACDVYQINFVFPFMKCGCFLYVHNLKAGTKYEKMHVWSKLTDFLQFHISPLIFWTTSLNAHVAQRLREDSHLATVSYLLCTLLITIFYAQVCSKGKYGYGHIMYPFCVLHWNTESVETSEAFLMAIMTIMITVLFSCPFPFFRISHALISILFLHNLQLHHPFYYFPTLIFQFLSFHLCPLSRNNITTYYIFFLSYCLSDVVCACG